jgi:hypothetical protein
MTSTWTELAHRCSDGVDVTLMWAHHGDAHHVRVCVCDRREGAFFELEPDPHLALDVFYHPYVYRGFSTLEYEDDRLAA